LSVSISASIRFLLGSEITRETSLAWRQARAVSWIFLESIKEPANSNFGISPIGEIPK